jgi:hypothetical protein
VDDYEALTLAIEMLEKDEAFADREVAEELRRALERLEAMRDKLVR